jgi:hypothetical protein
MATASSAAAGFAEAIANKKRTDKNVCPTQPLDFALQIR